MKSLETGKKSKRYLYTIVVVVSMGGFLFGYDVAVIAGTLPFLVDYFHLTPAMKGFAASSVILGAITGPLIGLWIADVLGRRKTMMLAASCILVSTLATALTVTIWNFACWRFLGGIGIGLAKITSPIYIAELSPASKRGSLVNINQLSDVLGINLAVLVGFFFAHICNGWRWMFASQAIPAIILLVAIFLIPESPRWLAAKSKLDEALKVLCKINGKASAEAELDEINKELIQEQGDFSELFQKGVRLALLIGVVIMVFSQINGVNMMLMYAPTIMLDAGINIHSDAILSVIPIYVFILICTLLAFKLIKHYSRRGLLITSLLFMALGHVTMAIFLQMSWPAIYMLIPMFIGAGAFTLGFAPLSWIIVSEIFPNRIRSKALSIVCFFLYVASFFSASLFPMVTNWFTIHFNSPAGTYWIFTVVCLLCAMFSWMYVPETKDLSLEKIGVFWKTKERTP